MSEQEPVTKVGAKLASKLNLGDFNTAEIHVWIEDRVRPDVDEGKASKAMDRIINLLDAKLETWAKELRDE